MPKRSFFAQKIVKHNKCYVANMRLLTKQTTSAARGTFYHCREAHWKWQQKFRYTATDTRDGTGQNCFCNWQYKLALSQINFKNTLQCCNVQKNKTQNLKHNKWKHSKLVGEKDKKHNDKWISKAPFAIRLHRYGKKQKQRTAQKMPDGLSGKMLGLQVVI